MNSAHKHPLLTRIEEQHINFVDLWFTDILGGVKSVTVPAEEIENVLVHGLHFDGSAIEGFGRVAESDMVLLPDANTFAVLPWENSGSRTARLICSVHTPGGDPFIGDPRNVLLRVLARARQMGFSYKTGMELEFFLFRTDENNRPLLGAPPYDESGYFDIADVHARGIRQAMIGALNSMGIRVNSSHSEIGHGQHEFDLRYTDALRSADNVLTARVVLKAIAQQHNLHCTFMPRPDANLPGSGMHTHQSLHEADGERNVFGDSQHEYGLSDLARHFLAGQLAHARAICAILAPLINSYKRLGTSFEAPVYVTWAHINRGALIRVPHVGEEGEAHTRLELRCPDPSSNPYLATAVMLEAGLDGIRNRMSLPDPLEETLLLQQSRSRMRHLEVLPTSLEAALDALQQDDVIVGALGPFIIDRYLALKQQELEDYHRQITHWELERYINRY